MVEPQEGGEEEAYPGGDAYTQEALEDLPAGDIHRFIYRIMLLRPKGKLTVEVTHTP